MKKKLKKIQLLLLIPLLLCGFLFVFRYHKDIVLSHPNETILYDRDDENIGSFIREFPSSYTSLNEVSSSFKQVLIAIEDQNFYQHHGFDFPRIVKSMITNIQKNSLTQGASTITQQLARIIYLNNEKSWERKLKEADIARKIERKYTKDKILELYINNVYFAHNLYGIDAASHYYFNKKPIDLSLQDSCILVGIINAPNLNSPFLHLDSCIKKMKSIAYQIYKNNVISIEEYYQILSNPLSFYGKKKEFSSMTISYLQGVEKELSSIKFPRNEQGVSIQTYLSNTYQKIIEDVINYYEIKDEISVVLMKPYSGQVLALCGGKSMTKYSFNRALDAKKAIGSTIKPLIYYEALKNGLSPLTKFLSEETTFTFEDKTTYTPHNANSIYAHRKINMVEAIAMSDNIYAVKTSIFLGLDKIKNLLKQFSLPLDNINYTISLGNIDLSPLQLASIYNAFASEGMYYSPSFIQNVTSSNGVTIYQRKSKPKRVFRYEECIMMNYLLQAPQDKAFISYSSPTMVNYPLKHPYALKTGSTSSSSFVVGFNPNYTLCVYIGTDDNSPLSDGTIAKKIFQKIANALPQKEEFYSYPNTLRPFAFHNSIYQSTSKTYLKKSNEI